MPDKHEVGGSSPLGPTKDIERCPADRESGKANVH